MGAWKESTTLPEQIRRYKSRTTKRCCKNKAIIPRSGSPNLTVTPQIPGISGMKFGVVSFKFLVVSNSQLGPDGPWLWLRTPLVVVRSLVHYENVIDVLNGCVVIVKRWGLCGQ